MKHRLYDRRIQLIVTLQCSIEGSGIDRGYAGSARNIRRVKHWKALCFETFEIEANSSERVEENIKIRAKMSRISAKFRDSHFLSAVTLETDRDTISMWADFKIVRHYHSKTSPPFMECSWCLGWNFTVKNANVYSEVKPLLSGL